MHDSNCPIYRKPVCAQIILKLILIVCLLVGLVGCFSSVEQLSNEEKLEDFFRLVSVFENDYPYLAVQERKTGTDWLANKETYVNRIKATKNDRAFIVELESIIAELRQGHTHLVSSSKVYDLLRDVYSRSWPQEFNIAQYDCWNMVLEESHVVQRYDMMRKLEKTSPALMESISSDLAFSTPFPTVGYFRVGNFHIDNLKHDQQRILAFLQEEHNLDTLIIDIRDNPGGSDLYWKENIVSVLTSVPLETLTYGLVKGGGYSRAFFESLGITLKPIGDMPLLPNVPPEASEFKYFTETKSVIEPKGCLKFEGKIYLLVNDKVFSAAETFASFAKVTGWATVVGSPTRGDGNSLESILLALPNSGLVVRFKAEMGLNPDGSCSQEYGTIPDILLSNGEDALAAVLALMAGD